MISQLLELYKRAQQKSITFPSHFSEDSKITYGKYLKKVRDYVYAGSGAGSGGNGSGGSGPKGGGSGSGSTGNGGSNSNSSNGSPKVSGNDSATDRFGE